MEKIKTRKDLQIIKQGTQIIMSVIDKAMNELKQKEKENLQNALAISVIREIFVSMNQEEQKQIIEALKNA